MNNRPWTQEYTEDALNDIKKLDGSVRVAVIKAIDKVSTNPLPQTEGGYGKPLGNKAGNNLSGLLKVKLKKSGIRIVYMLIREKEVMRIIIVGVRTDGEVYTEAAKRK